MLTDHYEKDLFYKGGREEIFDLEAYFRLLLPAREEQNGKTPQLLIGIELGYLPHLTGHLAAITSSLPFDGVILSLHILDGEDPFVDTSVYRRGKTGLYERYLSAMRDMTCACPDFDILGHFDYISRYSPYPDRKMYYAEIPDAFDALFKALAARGKALEINIRTVRKLKSAGYGDQESWPDPAIIRRYLELGGPGISLGSDGHHPGQAGQLFDEGAAWLQSIGCRHTVHFSKRQVFIDRLDSL
jgi:histidinol-phosphatase (PHP family)